MAALTPMFNYAERWMSRHLLCKTHAAWPRSRCLSKKRHTGRGNAWFIRVSTTDFFPVLCHIQNPLANDVSVLKKAAQLNRQSSMGMSRWTLLLDLLTYLVQQSRQAILSEMGTAVRRSRTTSGTLVRISEVRLRSLRSSKQWHIMPTLSLFV